MSTRPGSISSMRSIVTFLRRGSCSEALITVLNQAYGEPMLLEENGTMPFAGGIMQHGYQCGALWGAALGAGQQAYKRFGAGAQAEAAAVYATQRLVEGFLTQNTSINCLEITETDWNKPAEAAKYMLKGGPVRCFRRVARYAKLAHRTIGPALDEELEVPDAPVSCASVVAKRLGASEQQAVMSAGLAGGIGLSGGACGALGAAIWLIAIRSKEQGEKLDFKHPKALELVQKFLKQSDFEFECSAIVGRTFDTVSDHAGHVCEGGCAALLDCIVEAY